VQISRLDYVVLIVRSSFDFPRGVCVCGKLCKCQSASA